MKTDKTQYEVLADHFLNRGSISGVEAAAFYRIRALPRRIKDMEQRGWVFIREACVDPIGQRYVRYWLYYAPKGSLPSTAPSRFSKLPFQAADAILAHA